jgi:hypothetical protein
MDGFDKRRRDKNLLRLAVSATKREVAADPSESVTV